MSPLETALRIIGASQLGVIALVFFRQVAANRANRYTGFFSLGVACYLIVPLVLIEWNWGVFSFPVFLFAVLIPALFWFFIYSVFSDSQRFPNYSIILTVGTALLGTSLFFTGTESPTSNTFEVNLSLSRATHLIKLVWLGLGVVAICAEWKADLVEPRRQLRRWLVTACGCYIAVIIVVELRFPHGGASQLDLMNVALILVLVTIASIHLLSINSGNLFARIVTVTPEATTYISKIGQKVLAAMERERMYAEDGLTISTLAERINEQEYRVRKVINGELGFRNFNDFTNKYRVEEVARWLGQEEYRETPLLTLALEAGFRSLAPFNKSFKQRFGMTPSEYRHRLTKIDSSCKMSDKEICSNHSNISESNSIF